MMPWPDTSCDCPPIVLRPENARVRRGSLSARHRRAWTMAPARGQPGCIAEQSVGFEPDDVAVVSFILRKVAQSQGFDSRFGPGAGAFAADADCRYDDPDG